MSKHLAILLAMLFALTLSGCSLTNDAALVGKWDLKYLDTTIQTYEFTADGAFNIAYPSSAASGISIGLSYRYTANDGRGKIWFDGLDSYKLNLTYVITNNILDLTYSGLSVSGLVRRASK